MFHLQVSGTVLFWRAHVSAFRRRYKWCCYFGSSWPPSFLALWWSSSGCPPDTSLGQTFQHTRECYQTTHELGFKYKILTECKRKNTVNQMWNWLISARLDFDLKDSDDGPMVRRLNVRAACVLDHFYVLDVSALEQYSVLWKEIWHCWHSKDAQVKINFRSHVYETDLAGLFWRTVYEGVLCFEVLS